MSVKFFLIPLSAAIMLLVQTGRVLACAVCLSGADDAITEGYNASVLFLMATPYVVGACIAAGLLFAYRRASKRREEVGEEEAIVQLALKQEESSR